MKKKKFNIFPIALAFIMLLSVGAFTAWSSNSSDSSLDEEAYVLARLAYPYVKDEESPTRQAAVMWTFVNAANGGNVANVTGLFRDYNPNNPVTDDFNRSLLALARDVLLRRQAERNG